MNTQLFDTEQLAWHCIPFSKGKLYALVLLGIVMTAVAVVCMLLDISPLDRLMSVFAIAFFATCTIVALRRLFSSQCGLVLTDKWIDISPSRPCRIEWQCIVGISEITIKTSKNIVLEVFNPEYWIEQEQSFIKRKLMQANMALCGSPLAISSADKQISHDELYSLLLHYMDRFGTKS